MGYETPCPSLWALESEICQCHLRHNRRTDQMLLWTAVEVMDLDSLAYGDYPYLGQMMIDGESQTGWHEARCL